MGFPGIKGFFSYLWEGAPRAVPLPAQQLAPPDQRGVGNLENPSTSLNDPAPWLIEALGGSASVAGVNVTTESAMRLSAVYSCVRNISEDFASLPLHVFGENYRKAVELPEYELLHSRPNPIQTSYTWREMGQAHLELGGNWYNEIEFNGRGQPLALWPIPYWLVTPRLTQDRKDVVYEIRLPDGGTVTLPSWKVLHVPGFHYDGLRGVSRIRAAMNAIGLGAAAEAFGSNFFSNSARPSGYIKAPPTMQAKAAQEVLRKWNETHSGLDNTARTAMLLQGAEWQKIALTAEEAQFIETRKLQRSEIAAFWRMPPHMIGDLDKATFSNIEHQQLQYVMFTLRPVCVRFEQEIQRKLFSDNPNVRASVRLNGLMRGDAASRSKYYATGRQWGWLCVDDIRELEEMPPLPDQQGQIFLQPANMVEPGQEPADNGNAGAAGGMGGDPATEPNGGDANQQE